MIFKWMLPALSVVGKKHQGIKWFIFFESEPYLPNTTSHCTFFVPVLRPNFSRVHKQGLIPLFGITIYFQVIIDGTKSSLYNKVWISDRNVLFWTYHYWHGNTVLAASRIDSDQMEVWSQLHAEVTQNITYLPWYQAIITNEHHKLSLNKVKSYCDEKGNSDSDDYPAGSNRRSFTTGKCQVRDRSQPVCFTKRFRYQHRTENFRTGQEWKKTFNWDVLWQ